MIDLRRRPKRTAGPDNCLSRRRVTSQQQAQVEHKKNWGDSHGLVRAETHGGRIKNPVNL